MARTKQIARRRSPSGLSPSNDSAEDIVRIHKPVTSGSMQEGISPPPTVRGIPDALIDFLSQDENSRVEPPRKRRKTATGKRAVEHQDRNQAGPQHQYIVVKESLLEIRCAGSKLSGFDLTLRKNNISYSSPWNRHASSYSAHSLDIYDEAGNSLLSVPLSMNPPVINSQTDETIDNLDDIFTSLAVNRDSVNSPYDQGRLWTEVDIVLLRKDESDYIQIFFTLKWNVTTSPEYVIQKKKTRELLKVLETYFPDPKYSKTDTFSAQEFYNCVHSPEKEDAVAASIETDLNTDLYPFQKRAVQWLLRREGMEWADTTHGIQPVKDVPMSELPNTFRAVTDIHGQTFYVSHLFGIVTFDLEPFFALEARIKGGILAEEMGLGKTVEMIALMTLHKRLAERSLVFDAYTDEDLRPTGATLIISPPSISKQWIAEIQKHAPHLKVMHYQGIKNRRIEQEEILDSFANSDVVITTYAVLSAEINFTKLNPEKKLRHESKYPRRKSPLMQFSWWRVCLDEAQMVESGVSKAATVAKMIPRINAWAITGTPVRKNISDLQGLLIFLRYEPYASSQHIFLSLISSHKAEFQRLFGTVALRHSKRDVRDELKLPQQRRFVITMPFTPIEEQCYQELFEQMCEEANLNVDGDPITEDWNSQDYTEVMRRWLVRLRQTALHPEVGGRNRRALGQNKDSPLRTVDQVLDFMIEQADVAIRTDHRSLLQCRLKRGQLFENSPRVREALNIWEAVVIEAASMVQECREQISIELEKSRNGGIEARSHRSGSDAVANDQDESDPMSRMGTLRTRLRGALELEHMALFFRANAYFQIKTNEEMTKPDSAEFQELERLETEGYEAAKKLRREILQEVYNKTNTLMQIIAGRAESQNFVEIPAILLNITKGGLESRRIVENFHILGNCLDAQANQIDEWREHLIQILLRPLVDEDDGLEVNGDEYEESTKLQDEVMVYVHVLRTMIADRHKYLTGFTNNLAEQEAKAAVREAKAGKGPYPEKTLELFHIREQHVHRDQNTLREIVSELRNVASSLRSAAEDGNVRAQHELSIVEKQLSINRNLTEQSRVITALEKEIELFTSIMNSRLEYYRQLQVISDGLSPYEGPRNDKVVAKMIQDEEKLYQKLAAAKAKRRYLLHLKLEAKNPEEKRICVICRDEFEVGALTVCGHQYCHDCIKLWWSSHHNCPVCKRKLIQADLHEITYKPQELSIQTEELHEPVQARSPSSSISRKSKIYSDVSKATLAQIKNIELPGNFSFGTKIDTLARHLLYLRESDPGAKSIVFSQFKDFLSVLSRAFQRYRIGFTSIDKSDGIEKFKNDAGIEVFLLHARAHSAGLTLVNASHVFLCEPLLNTALELQAIARVDRIGQTVGTSVWLYLVGDTVEESIYELSVKRRLEHLGHAVGSKKGKGRELTEDELVAGGLEEANSMELQDVKLADLLAKGTSGGEAVGEDDLWECLFGGRAKRNATNLSRGNIMEDEVVRRDLAAQAADARTAD
ncbi:hypothetical protein CJF32_00002864 [Rutstroemia sp. NJR-2017a WRK4]|nr:hypothetical protein CJF32_00002864 [Rutstroemia sp. NJR-2017a WRK4]